VSVSLAGLVYTLWFSGALGSQPVTVAATGHTITATAAQVTAGVAPAAGTGSHGVVVFPG
jgi:hypothetical protein